MKIRSVQRKDWTSWCGKSGVDSPGKGASAGQLSLGTKGGCGGLCPRAFSEPVLFHPTVGAPVVVFSCAPTSWGAAPGAVGASGDSKLCAGRGASGGWMTAWQTRGQAGSGVFKEGWTEMGARPSQEGWLLSLQDLGSLEFLWPVLGLSLLATAASGSPSRPHCPQWPCGSGVS